MLPPVIFDRNFNESKVGPDPLPGIPLKAFMTAYTMPAKSFAVFFWASVALSARLMASGLGFATRLSVLGIAVGRANANLPPVIAPVADLLRWTNDRSVGSVGLPKPEI